jgi:hypothetical protein
MLSSISPADAAMPAHARFRMGASLSGGCAAVSLERRAEEAVTRTAAAEAAFAGLSPQPSTGRSLFGNATHAAGQVNSAWQQPTSQKYAHTTRIAAAGGGALGPHPARDPV